MNEVAFLDPFRRLLEDISTPEHVRAIEGGGDISAMWNALVDSGYLDALVPEAAGGVGLALRDISGLVEALGRCVMPLPVAETMAARALLAANAAEIPAGPIVLASAYNGEARQVPLAAVAEHALVDTGSDLLLIDLDRAALRPLGVHGSLAAGLRPGVARLSIPRPSAGIRPLAAVLRSAQIAGAAARLLEMTTEYANQRQQFGKPIGKQQAIQQQLSVMAEKMVMIRMAAGIGCACDLLPDPAAAAVAKSVASAGAIDIATIAHAVHGAIGISEEHDLQLYTRKLHEWRFAEGSEGYWWNLLGQSRLASDATTTIDFIRDLCAAA